MLVNVLVWCLFGLLAGLLAQWIMPGKDPGQRPGLLGWAITILLGIAGAVVGGWIASQLFNLDVSGFNLPSFGIAVAGALLLLVLYRLIFSMKAR
jgi:uncharacterized membrane protein YeaQ/YmgE (transglycosylase-associated protein family)